MNAQEQRDGVNVLYAEQAWGKRAEQAQKSWRGDQHKLVLRVRDRETREASR